MIEFFCFEKFQINFSYRVIFHIHRIKKAREKAGEEELLLWICSVGRVELMESTLLSLPFSKLLVNLNLNLNLSPSSAFIFWLVGYQKYTSNEKLKSDQKRKIEGKKSCVKEKTTF